MLRRRFVRGASVAIHVVFIALTIWYAWWAQQSVFFSDETGTANAIAGMLAIALATTTTVGLILWLKRGRVAILLVADLVYLILFGDLVWEFKKVGYLPFLLALGVALYPVLTDPRARRAGTPVYWPGSGPGVPPNAPRATGSDERDAPPSA